MSSIAEIEEAITKLPSEDFKKLADWFDEERNRKWDQQIEADSNSGVLDHLIAEVEEEIKANRVRPADELLDNR
jgi:hypothetical protein